MLLQKLFDKKKGDFFTKLLNIVSFVMGFCENEKILHQSKAFINLSH